MKKLIGYIIGVIGVLAGIYAAIRIINRKRFEKQDFTEGNDEEDIFEKDPVVGDENPVYVSDRTGDGNIDTFMMDTTGDGKIDTVLLDTTGDGELDTIYTDFN